jgi:spore coat polysaccharide biosynthesis predicted glycosyltransferase SpsG
MKVLILTEAGSTIGFGHLTRSIALYQGFDEEKIDVEIVVNWDRVAEYLLKGIKHKIFNWLQNRNTIFETIKEMDIVIIDSYTADLEFYQQVSKIVRIPVYIDDYVRLDYPRGTVISPSIYGDKLNYPEKDGVRYLLGKDYIILRKEFWDVPEKKIKKKIKNILITFGGANHQNLAKKFSEYLKDKFNFNIYIVDPRMKFTAKDMVNFMLKADLCISGGGQTTYELARVGVPTIGICFAENQLNNLIYGQKEGYLEFAGWFDDKELLVRIEEFLMDLNYEKRVKMKKFGEKSVDGRGVRRLLKAI